jgi:penicillin amidase
MAPVRTPQARRRFTVFRDVAGVPHVTADSWLDALYGLGYMHARDRGTQLLFARAVASGRAAEQIRDRADLLETDRFFRRIGLHLRLDREIQELEPRIAWQLESYCEGVSDGIQGSGRSLPMWATRFRPARWDMAAVLLVGRLLSFGGLAISQLQSERLILELIHAGVNDAALRELFSPRLDGVDFDLLRKVTMSNQLSTAALDLITDLPRLAGSNAWAVSAQRSATGSALLASDPHLEINRLPAIWYEVVLRWDDHYVLGATLPGCPLFAVARTERLAWGVTYMKGDTIDYFIEECRPKGVAGWQYRRADRWHDFDVREEVIERKGKGAEVLPILENAQGTLETPPAGPGYYLSVAWTGASQGAGRAMATWLDIVFSASTLEAMDVASQCPQPTLCFVFADAGNHIGLQGCGRFPRRREPDGGLLPVAAWEEDNHWRGWLPQQLLPRLYDPPEGFLATANEGWNPPGGPLLVTQILPDYRKRRIDQCLRQLPQATVADMQRLQYDTVSLQARELLPVLLPHLPTGTLRQRLQDWDHSYAIDSLEATLFQRLYINTIIEIFGHDDVLGWRRIVYLCTRAGYSNMVLTLADRVLRQQDSRWWRNRDKGELIRRAAARVAQQPDCRWGEFNHFHFTDRFFGRRRAGRLLGFESGWHPMPGCYATPFQGHVYQTAKHEQTFAPSYHFVTDMGTHEAWTNLPGGPSESRFSKYYKSDLTRWEAGSYKRLAPRGDEERDR